MGGQEDSAKGFWNELITWVKNNLGLIEQLETWRRLSGRLKGKLDSGLKLTLGVWDERDLMERQSSGVSWGPHLNTAPNRDEWSLLGSENGRYKSGVIVVVTKYNCARFELKHAAASKRLWFSQFELCLMSPWYYTEIKLYGKLDLRCFNGKNDTVTY